MNRHRAGGWGTNPPQAPPESESAAPDESRDGAQRQSNVSRNDYAKSDIQATQCGCFVEVSDAGKFVGLVRFETVADARRKMREASR